MMKTLNCPAMRFIEGGDEMKAFSVAFRDKATGKLYGGVVDHTELCRLSNLETITICCVREIPLDKSVNL